MTKVTQKWLKSGSKVAKTCLKSGSKVAQKWFKSGSKVAKKWMDECTRQSWRNCLDQYMCNLSKDDDSIGICIGVRSIERPKMIFKTRLHQYDSVHVFMAMNADNQESPRQTKPKKGQNEKFMNFAHFFKFWCFSLGKQARFTYWTFVPECPCEKFMNWPFFGLVCRATPEINVWSKNWKKSSQGIQTFGPLFRSGPGKPNQRKVSSWTFCRGIPEPKFNVNRACFPKEKHQNSQEWAKFMNFFVLALSLVWFAGVTPDLFLSLWGWPEEKPPSSHFCVTSIRSVFRPLWLARRITTLRLCERHL